MSRDNRFLQRLENFNRAYALLEKVVAIKQPSEIEQMALIKSYELVFELAWKLMKDYLEAKGQSAKGPRDAIKRAYEQEIIDEGGLWLVALDKRNLTAHTYDEETAEAVAAEIRKAFFPMIAKLHAAMAKEVGL